jgi:hypothetical protein
MDEVSTAVGVAISYDTRHKRRNASLSLLLFGSIAGTLH